VRFVDPSTSAFDHYGSTGLRTRTSMYVLTRGLTDRMKVKKVNALLIPEKLEFHKAYLDM